jgi:hypothetical protein
MGAEGDRYRRREDWDDERDLRRRERDDFGLADFSGDYAYDPDRRAGYRTADAEAERRGHDYGQADYSTDYANDRGRAYRRFSEDRRYGEPERAYRRELDREDDRRRWDEGPRPGEPSRSWAERAGAFFRGEPGQRRRGPSDRVLWAVIVERLEDQRGLDLRDVEVLVDDAAVTLNGTVRRKEDRRRIEDVADLEGVRHVQNNLRVRGRRWF